jgi:hypothetical protein
MKRILLIALGTIILFTLASAAWYYTKVNKKVHKTVSVAAGVDLKRGLMLAADSILPYAVKHKFNTDFCFIINMRMESGSNRFFIYDLSKDSVTDAGLVTHGRCNASWLSGRKYDNKIGCGCTSLGKYRIGKPYNGTFGLAYKLHGLDNTNSNAFKRYVVLHSHECVPNEEVKPAPICQSDGCPTVSQAFLKKLATKIDTSPKPILLYIYDHQ